MDEYSVSNDTKNKKDVLCENLFLGNFLKTFKMVHPTTVELHLVMMSSNVIITELCDNFKQAHYLKNKFVQLYFLVINYI